MDKPDICHYRGSTSGPTERQRKVSPVSDTISEDSREAIDHDHDHDHAWRLVDKSGARYGVVGEYRCDLCPAVWSM